MWHSSFHLSAKCPMGKKKVSEILKRRDFSPRKKKDPTSPRRPKRMAREIGFFRLGGWSRANARGDHPPDWLLAAAVPAAASAAVGVAATIAAATAEYDESEDDEPYPVVIEQLAEAVRIVVHNVPPD